MSDFGPGEPIGPGIDFGAGGLIPLSQHQQLSHRGDPDQHPMSAITGLVAALGTGSGAIDVTLIVGTAAVDGTATSFAILGWDQNATASGLAPAQYATQATVTASELVGYLTGVLGFASTDDVTVLVPAGTHIGAWTFTPDTIGDPWTEVAGSLAVQASSNYLGVLFGTGTPLWLKVNDADSVGYEGSGLLLGVLKAHDAFHTVEGLLDRWSFVGGMCLTTNIDITATNPALEYGDCVPGGRVFLNAQTTTSQNGHYYVNGDLTITRINYPDVFDPPGNGYRTTLVAPADPAHGLTLMWLDDDRANFMRGGAIPQAGTEGDPGEWVTVFDPTATGGGVALGETSTTAYRGDRGKTAYDYSQAHTGATDPHGDRSYAAALVAARASKTLWAAKGSIATGTSTANTPAEVVVGANGTSLMADSTQAGGVRWGGPGPRVAKTTGEYYGLPSSNQASGVGASGAMRAFPVWLPAGTLDRIAVYAGTGAASTWRLGIYRPDGTGSPHGQAPLLDAGTLSTNATGTIAITISQAITEGMYWLALLCDAYTAAPTVQCAFYATAGFSMPGNPINVSSVGRSQTGHMFAGVPTGAMPTYPALSSYSGAWVGTMPSILVRYAA